MLRNTEKVINGSTFFFFLMCQGFVFWLKLSPCSLRGGLPSLGGTSGKLSVENSGLPRFINSRTTYWDTKGAFLSRFHSFGS